MPWTACSCLWTKTTETTTPPADAGGAKRRIERLTNQQRPGAAPRETIAIPGGFDQWLFNSAKLAGSEYEPVKPRIGIRA